MKGQNTPLHHYLGQIQQIRALSHTTGELSYHATLKSLLEEVAQALRLTLQVVHEPARLAYGRPDFIILQRGLPVGYLEAEKYATNLDHLSGQAKEQNDRFIQNLDNFLLTNFLEFRLYRNGTLQARAKLPEPPERGTLHLLPSEIESFQSLLESFLTASPPTLSTPKELADHLARRTRQLKQATYLLLQNDKDSELRALHKAFERTLLPDLDFADFTDMYAQTIAYGLFAARCSAPNEPNFTLGQGCPSHGCGRDVRDPRDFSNTLSL